MAISGLQTINIGLQNESTGSDSLYVAFNKAKDNFSTLFACASPYNTYTGNTGIAVTANSTAGIIDILNTGVNSIIAGTGITIDQANGDVTISAVGSGGGAGTVTSVGLIPAARLSVTGSPIVSSGNMYIDLVPSGVSAGTYTYATVSVDAYGRVTSISSGAASGTVTSVGITPGYGIQVTGSPVTTSGSMTVVNTGVTRLSAGTGISLSGSNGNVTVSTTVTGGTVTSVGLSSTTLDVSGSPIVSAGTIAVNLPDPLTVENVVLTGSLTLSGSETLNNGDTANLAVTTSYLDAAGSSIAASLLDGVEGLIKTFMVGNGSSSSLLVTNAGWKSSGDGGLTFNSLGAGCTLQYINGKWFIIGSYNVSPVV